MNEMQVLLSTENLASGTSSKVVLNSVEFQVNSLLQSKNNEILSESLNKLVMRQDNLQIQSLYQCPDSKDPPSMLKDSQTSNSSQSCPSSQTVVNYRVHNQIVNVVYNPSIYEQEGVTVKFQMKNVDEANSILSGMTAIVWNRTNRAYVDVNSQTLCYSLPPVPKAAG